MSQSANLKRLPYRAPELKEYGSVAKVTEEVGTICDEIPSYPGCTAFASV